MEECYEILNPIDPYDYPSNTYVTVRSATAMSLIKSCTHRGGNLPDFSYISSRKCLMENG